MSHFETLGLDGSATPDQVKAAYRKLAQEWHPDRNKSPEAEARFKAIKEAYEALTGDTGPDNSKAQMLERVAALVRMTVESELTYPDLQDLIAMLKANVGVAQSKLKSSIDQTARAVNKREKVLARLKGPEEGFLLQVLRKDIELHKASIAQLETALVETNEILELLREYSYSTNYYNETQVQTRGILNAWK